MIGPHPLFVTHYYIISKSQRDGKRANFLQNLVNAILIFSLLLKVDSYILAHAYIHTHSLSLSLSLFMQ